VDEYEYEDGRKKRNVKLQEGEGKLLPKARFAFSSVRLRRCLVLLDQ